MEIKIKKRHWFLSISFFVFSFTANAQSKADSIYTILKNANNSIEKLKCTEYQPISYRAMNLFMADRVGYYLAESENLTYTKNNLTLNTADGIMSMTHSFFEPSGSDLPLTNFTALGLKTNIFNAYQASNNKTTYKNELGLTIKKYWISKPKIFSEKCIEKEIADASRAVILENIRKEILDKSFEFENNLMQNVPDSNISNTLKSVFYSNLKEDIWRKFATLQFRDLFENMRFKRIAMQWTTANVYLPVINQKVTVAPNLEGNFLIKKTYPAEISISHTRFTEWRNASKFYFSIRGAVQINNSINSKIIQENTVSELKDLGLKNTSYLVDKQLDRVYFGEFRNFITPNLKTQIVYFPPQNHFGISASLVQNFGKFKAFNGVLGIPVVLIDKQGESQTNFEIQIHYFDMTNSLNSARKFSENISIGVSFGQPIGRRVY